MKKVYLLIIALFIIFNINNKEENENEKIVEPLNKNLEQNQKIDEEKISINKNKDMPKIEEENIVSTYTDESNIAIKTILSTDKKYEIKILSDSNYKDNIINFMSILIEATINNSKFFIKIDKDIYSYKENKIYLDIKELSSNKEKKIIFDIKNLEKFAIYDMNIHFEDGFLDITKKTDLKNLKKEIDSKNIDISKFQDSLMQVEKLNQKLEKNKINFDINNSIK